MATLTLGELIAKLKTYPADMVVFDGFGEGHCDRGYYSNAAFDPVGETTMGEMLAHAKALLNTTQTGWKGGDYLMHEHVDTHIGYVNQCGDPITMYNFKYWEQQSGYNN
jgi:hypothetical protein